MIFTAFGQQQLTQFFTLKKLAAGVSTNMSPYIHRDPQVYWMPQDIGVLQRRWVAWFGVIFFAEKKVEEVALLGVSIPPHKWVIYKHPWYHQSDMKHF